MEFLAVLSAIGLNSNIYFLCNETKPGEKNHAFKAYTI